MQLFRVFLVFLLFSISSKSIAQALTENEKLASLAKIWGFLKYYHPAVAAGKIDWDGRLIQLFPIVQKAHDRQQLSEIYDTLIDELGPVKVCRKCRSETEIGVESKRNLNLSFLTDSITLTNLVRDKLKYIKENRYQKNVYYAQSKVGQAELSFENENDYANISLPDNSYRLLALFRYWNIINYYYPYKYALDSNWNEVLTKMIPIFQQAITETSYQLALYRLSSRIQDSHGVMSSKDPSRCLRCDLGRLWLPFEIQIVDEKAIITRLYDDSISIPPYLKVGMVISHIDGETIKEKIDQLRPLISASTAQALNRDVKGLIGLGSRNQAQITFELSGKDSVVTVSRYPYKKLGTNLFQYASSQYPVSTWLADKVGYVNMGKLTDKQVDSVMTSLISAKAIIFDLRNYPKGTYWLVGRYLVNKPLPFAQITGPDLNFPGIFNIINTAKLTPFSPAKQYQGKVFVLINEDTQSQAEFTAMAFRTHPNTTLVGSSTAGADGNMSWIPLPGGYKTAFSGLGVYYPDGRETQRVGIIPDIIVQPSKQGIQRGVDDVLRQAIELINKDK